MVTKAYANEERRQAALGRGIDWRVSRPGELGEAAQLCGQVV